jgi:hypothetical protein
LRAMQRPSCWFASSRPCWMNELVNTTSPQKGCWKELWALVRDIGAGFRGVRYPSHEDLNTAWQRYQTLCQEAKIRGDANREEMEVSRRNGRSARSKRLAPSRVGTTPAAKQSHPCEHRG